MSEYMEIGLSEVQLTWYVIDDNPHYFSIYVNNSIWKYEIPLTANLINITFTNVPGFYNINLSVTDYSGYYSQSNLVIKILNPASPSSSSTQPAYSSSSPSASASDSYTSLEVVGALITIFLVIKIKQKFNKRGK